MPTEQTPKQLIVQRIKDATNILVTVSHDPSVDELSAALAMTLMLEKMDKAATAVFSGQIPAAIDFLEPGKTFDTNVDGLRDFIIALDKSKADRLRYKVEDDVVRVFITPYQTTITEKDLSFSQGDFNVDLIIAFGVERREDLDTAITAHGRILHDAGVITISQLPGGSSMGEVDWSDTEASSLCEMLMSLTESLQTGIVDKPIATAILTGLVAATDRFRNDKTSPKVMTMAAQLMASGANQQLIAEKLEEASTVSTGKLNTDTAQSVEPAKTGTGEMRVEHAEANASKVMNIQRDEEDTVEAKAREVADQQSNEAVAEANNALAAEKPEAPADLPPVQTPPSLIEHAKVSSWRDAPIQPPSTGGSLSATSEQAVEDKRRAEEDDKNHVLLSHDAPRAEEPVSASPAILNATTLADAEPTVQDIFAGPLPPTPAAQPTQAAPVMSEPPVLSPAPNEPVTGPAAGLSFEETPRTDVPAPLPPTTPAVNETLADLEAEVQQQTAQPAGIDALDAARAAVDAALGTSPSASPAAPSAIPAQADPVLQPNDALSPLFPTAPTVPQAPAAAGVPLPPLPPLPDFSTLPPLPGETTPSMPAPATAPSFGLPEQPAPNEPSSSPMFPVAGEDPGQFKLPGQ